MAKKLEISNEQARAYYDNNPKKYFVPERIKMRHILLKVPEGADDAKRKEILEKAEQIRKKIIDGAKFEAVAMTESQDESSAPKGGDLGFFSRGHLGSPVGRSILQTEGKVTSRNRC